MIRDGGTIATPLVAVTGAAELRIRQRADAVRAAAAGVEARLVSDTK